MGSDRARVSYDHSRQYRSVVAQQGRVTTEADTNEAWTINGEQTREQILDIVGPAGTPDNGYRVIPPGAPSTPPFEFTVGLGTMYVGGLRSFLPEAVSYSTQNEWLDREDDPDWISPKTPADPQKARELVYLSLIEQEVSATEDRALLEVALGGPDTSQRTRLIQHIKRLGTNTQTCDDALLDAKAAWAAQGLSFDPTTMRLNSNTRLQVSFTSTGTPPDPCTPQDQGGYLGADNQLIRIRITTWNPDTNTGRLVWGFDDASFQYRIDIVKDSLVQLQSRPPDDLHEPQSGQAIELLRSAVRLDDTDAFIASATGVVMTLTDAYQPDTRRITLPLPLTPTYTNPTQTPMVFLRVWEQELEFTPGTPVTLGLPERPTGMQLTLTSEEASPFHPGNFWLVTVRPSTPTQAYPARYLIAPQPPDGPRTWACPLAVVEWTQGVMQVLADCRNPFDNLVELTARRQGSGCCDVLIRPEDLNHTSLQDIIDQFVIIGHFTDKGQVTICLTPGNYPLPEPLRLGAQHSHLTIEACHNGAVIAAAAGKENNFFDGLVVLNQADNVTLRGLQFKLPQVPFAAGGVDLTSTPLSMLAAITPSLNVAIGVRPTQCAVLTVEDCLFRFTTDPKKACFGVGIFAQGECSDHRIRRNHFARGDNTTRPFRIFYGYLLASAVSLNEHEEFGSMAPAMLHDSSFCANTFSDLATAIAIYAPTGAVEMKSNTVRGCFNGFTFRSDTQVVPNAIRRAVTDSAALDLKIADLLVAMLLNPGHVGGVLAQFYPLPQDATLPDTVAIEADRDAGMIAILTELSRAIEKTIQTTAEEEHSTKHEQSDSAADAEPKTGIDPIAQLVRLRTQQATENATQLGLPKEVFSRLVDAQIVLAKLGRAAASTPPPLRLSLHLCNEDVQTNINNKPTGSGLEIARDPKDSQPGDLTMVGCRFLGRTGDSLVPILLVQRCAISGNLILNEEPLGTSLSVFPANEATDTEHVAVVGNVLMGTQTILPPRQVVTPPLDPWERLNALEKVIP